MQAFKPNNLTELKSKEIDHVNGGLAPLLGYYIANALQK